VLRAHVLSRDDRLAQASEPLDPLWITAARSRSSLGWLAAGWLARQVRAAPWEPSALREPWG
jgi:hypothetical protein